MTVNSNEPTATTKPETSIYNPVRFRQNNPEEILRLIWENPLATLISVVDGATFVSHLPLVAKMENSQLKLLGHLAKANPHWRALDGQPVLAIFHGPQSYITPTWYVQNDVPTWNYAVIHSKGQSRLITDFTGVTNCLRALTAQMEKNSKSPWEFWLPEDLDTPATLTGAIVGFEISIELNQIEAKFKLGQNRSSEDQRRVAAGLLSERTDGDSHNVAELMKRLAGELVSDCG